MKKYLILLPLFLISCTVSQKIIYETNDISVPESSQTINAMVEVRVLVDNRANIEVNDLLFTLPRQTKITGTTSCINSEKHYKKDTVVNQITKLMVDHFNKAKLFRLSLYNHSEHAGYFLTGTLNSFYGKQDYSHAAAVGASFGIIGALATMGVKSPGTIIIEMSDLKLFSKDGTLIKDFGNFYKEYSDEFKADANCWCIYWNINEKLKDFNTHLIETIRYEMAEVVLN